MGRGTFEGVRSTEKHWEKVQDLGRGGHTSAMQNWLNQSKCRLKADSCGPKKPELDRIYTRLVSFCRATNFLACRHVQEYTVNDWRAAAHYLHYPSGMPED